MVATVKSATTRPMRQRRGLMLTVTVTDGTHDMTLTFFRPYGHLERLVPGRTGLFAGKVQRYRSTWQLAHPNYELFDSDDTDAALGVYAGGLVPVYLAVPKLDSWAITKSMRIVFDHLDEVDDPVPVEVRRERGLDSLLEALPARPPAQEPGGRPPRRAPAALRRGVHRAGRARPAPAGQRRRAHHAAPSASRRAARGLRRAAAVRADRGQRRGRRADRRRARPGAPDAPAAAGRGRLGQDRRGAAGDAVGHRRRRPGRAAGTDGGPRRPAPPLASAPCSATSPRAACSAAARWAPGWRCSPAASRPPYAARHLLDVASGEAGIVDRHPRADPGARVSSSTSASSSSTSSTGSASSSGMRCAARGTSRRTCS